MAKKSKFKVGDSVWFDGSNVTIKKVYKNKTGTSYVATRTEEIKAKESELKQSKDEEECFSKLEELKKEKKLCLNNIKSAKRNIKSYDKELCKLECQFNKKKTEVINILERYSLNNPYDFDEDDLYDIMNITNGVDEFQEEIRLSESCLSNNEETLKNLNEAIEQEKKNYIIKKLSGIEK